MMKKLISSTYVSDFIDSFQNLTYKSLGMYVLYTYEEKKFKIANV